MTMYAPRDHTNIRVPAGCGATHDTLTEAGQLVVDCAACEPIIAQMGHGWAYTHDAVAQTPDEVRDDETRRKNAERQQITTWSTPGAFSEMMTKALTTAGASPTTGPGLIQQLMAMSVEERRTLAALLNPPAVEVSESVTSGVPVAVTLEPEGVAHAQTATAASGSVTVESVVKRGPGRPPKAK